MLAEVQKPIAGSRKDPSMAAWLLSRPIREGVRAQGQERDTWL